ncbi:MAG: glycosyltransferase family 4 protein [Phycisphaerae bacterium]|jgi:glycosyltransferase involved in cell wall biosynthesis
MSNRQRILVIAEACNPTFTSVPLQAYQRLVALSRYADITVVTQVRNRTGFEDADSTLNNTVFIDTERVAAPLHRLGKIITLNHPSALGARSAVAWPAYLYFEDMVWNRFGHDIRSGKFDVVHRLTPVSPTFPSPIAQKCNTPFILGPINGALPWPGKTRNIWWKEGEFLTPLRGLYRMLPYVRSTYEHARLILTAARHVEREVPPRIRKRCVRFPGNGVDTTRFSAHDRRPPGDIDPFTILFVGRLIPLKKPGLIIESLVAAGLARNSDARIVYVGAGPERPTLERLAAAAGLTNRVTFADWVPHDELPRFYRQGSVLALPSIHESGGAVLLEAMACGLPSVVVDYGGPAEYISSDVGVRVPLGSHEQLVRAFASTFRKLYDDRQSLDRLSTAGLRTARDRWSWDAHARRLVQLYRSISE